MRPDTDMQQLDPAEFGKLGLCFAPSSAAIIGASTDPLKFGGRALKFCLERNFRGRLYPVNARNDVVQGLAAYRSVADLPEAPDIAVIAVPAPLVKENLAAAGEKGARAAIVYGARFAEAGAEGKARQDELLAIARSWGMRMIGPNCMGVMSLASGFVASFTSAPEHHGGRGWPDLGSVSVASQSGAVGIQIFAQLRDRGLGLRHWISTGNQADVDVADAIAYFAGDAGTRTIAVYMEDASRGMKLVEALEIARQARKPVAILKVGTTPLGGVAAKGHTAAMYVEDRVVDDLFAQYGVLRARSINELIDLAAASDAGVVPESPEVAAVSVSGGGAVMISDAASRHGLELSEFRPEALAALKESNSFVNDRNPIDISAPSMSNMTITGGSLKWGLEQGQPSMLGYISHVPLVPRTRTGIMPQLLQFRAAHPGQLIAVAANLEPEDRKALVRSGMAVFDDPVVATESVAKLVGAGQAYRKPALPPSPPGEPVPKGEIRTRLARAGIDMAPEHRVDTADEAALRCDAWGSIVLKLAAAGLRHRTELDGVRTGIRTGNAAREAFTELHARINRQRDTYPDLHILASPMISGVEMLVGVRRDPHFGPLVLLATGGTLCELLDDLVCRKAPISRADADAMIESVRGARMLDGWRGNPAASRESLAEALVAMSDVAPVLPSLEINPLFVTEDGLTGVDLVVGESTGGAP